MDVSLGRKEFESYLSTRQLSAAFDHLSNASPEGDSSSGTPVAMPGEGDKIFVAQARMPK